MTEEEKALLLRIGIMAIHSGQFIEAWHTSHSHLVQDMDQKSILIDQIIKTRELNEEIEDLLKIVGK